MWTWITPKITVIASIIFVAAIGVISISVSTSVLIVASALAGVTGFITAGGVINRLNRVPQINIPRNSVGDNLKMQAREDAAKVIIH